MSFREFMDQSKPWKAKRAEIIQFWQSLRPFLPINAQPVPKQRTDTRFKYDGLRITGNAQFINSILSRIKDLLRFEDQPGVKLDIEYEQIETKSGELHSEPRFVCYIYVMEEPGSGIKKPSIGLPGDIKTPSLDDIKA